MKNTLDTLDTLTRKACQLRALLTVSTDKYFTGELSEDLRADYLWACSDLAEGIYTDLQKLEVKGLSK